MAGANSLLVQEYPDDFQVVTTYTWAAAGVNDPFPILYADRDIVIDSIVIGVRTPAAEGNARLVFEVAGGPNVDSSTDLVCTANIDSTNGCDSGDTFVHTTDGVTRTSNAGASLPVIASTAISSSANLVEKGKWLVGDFSTSLTNYRLAIQVRFRSRVA